jgi:glycosyltransferase involved in cell wall biosynthesis
MSSAAVSNPVGSPAPPDRQGKALVSIILCTRERCRDLQQTLESLSGVASPEEYRTELLVVENGTRGEAEAIVAGFRHPGIVARYRFVPHPGKSGALNLAVAETAGEVLLFTDDDVRLPADWIEQMAGPLLRREGEVTVGGSRLAPGLLRDWMTRYHRCFLASTEYLDDDAPSEFAGVNVGCHRKVFARVPGFDSELGGGGLGNCEDVLFARQLRQAGCRFVSRTHVHVEHHPAVGRLAYASWQRAAASIGRSQAYLLHHWEHEGSALAPFRAAYYRAKLGLRLALHRRRGPQEEGIPAWELSYRIDLAKWSHLLHERKRVRHYAKRGLRRLPSAT